ncbi:hypothetical protein QGN29_12180 [Temperatibacter marinus]|uniref:XapX domain-containing protein n=1 Tax=Temperatibacter marinus TaxID=1456591 RepID=A0AA52EHT5_9PROT|nr:hypothetical protein [Temperatibacter marinus]WND02306.1 hypothetical protein QGN29_12180 [Temperatibacter marinus]
MGTRLGFFAFLGLILGAIIGNWLPFMPALEAVAGMIIAIGLAVILDKKDQPTS